MPQTTPECDARTFPSYRTAVQRDHGETKTVAETSIHTVHYSTGMSSLGAHTYRLGIETHTAKQSAPNPMMGALYRVSRRVQDSTKPDTSHLLVSFPASVTASCRRLLTCPAGTAGTRRRGSTCSPSRPARCASARGRCVWGRGWWCCTRGTGRRPWSRRCRR